ncbi:MAG TPA: ABC transporter ATP-binding protein [Armatimonadota bacterium]|nr:ABC transporter ATP-binding protein [Armatimonadota bacterium]
MARPIYDDEVLGKAFDARLTRRALVFVLPYKKQLGIALAAMLVTAGTALVSPHLMQVAIDDGIKAENVRVVTATALIYIVTYLIRWFSQYWQTIFISILGQHVVNDIRQKLFSHIQGLSLDFFDRREVGRIIARLTSDVGALNMLITSGVLSLVTDFMTLIGIVIIMLKKSLMLSLLTFTLMPLMAVVTAVFRGRARLAYRDVRKKVATVTAHVAENVSGVKVVKSFSREGENLQRFEQVNRENRDAFMRAQAISAAFSPTMEIISWIGIAMIYWYGGLQAIYGTLKVGVLVAFIAYMHQFFAPMRNMSAFYQNMQSAMAGAERIFDIFDTEPSVRDKPGANELPQIQGNVEFRNVNFAYDETPVLKDVSFTAKAGETIALVGPTGAGKTTIINLLARQYDIQSGSILIDGCDVRDVTTKSLRSQMGIVPQDSFLFPGSVRENIRYGRLDATDGEVEAAAKAVGAHEFIMELPEGYETDVREGGSKLSSGQKQVVSFARALLADPRILILDEATSSVDTQTEMLIQEAIRKLLKGRTSFVIAHRLSTVIEAGCILVIDDGRIVESGKHEELLRNDGLYRRLYDMQFSFETAGDEVAADI